MAGRYVMAAAVLALSPVAMAQQVETSGTGRPLVLKEVPMKAAVDVIVRQMTREPYVLCDRALNDNRPVSLRLPAYALKFDTLAGVLRSYGYQVRNDRGVLYVCPQTNTTGQASVVPIGGNVPMGNPLDPSLSGPVALPQKLAEGTESTGQSPVPAVPLDLALLGYRPSYVDPADLQAATSPLFEHVKVQVVAGSGVVPAIFGQGPRDDVERWDKMVRYLDRPSDAVEVQALLVEVTSSERKGFGVSAVLDVVRKGVGFSIGAPLDGDSLSFRAPNFSAVASAVGSDARTRIVSSPRLRGRAGEKLMLNVGQQVPTLGAIVLGTDGRSTQSVEYRQSGTTLEITAKLYRERIGLDVRQELSAFAVTQTGVNNSPTLATRSIATAVDMSDGDWIILGGLSGEDGGTTRTSLLGLIPTGRERRASKTELVLLLNVRRVSVFSDRGQVAEVAQ